MEVNAGVAVVAEPWWIPPGSAEWCPALGGTPSAAVLVSARVGQYSLLRRSEYFVAVRIHGCVVVSVYFPPSESLGEFEVLLEDLSALLEDQPWPSRVVVAGDFNARSDSWDPGCRENARGRLLAEWTSRSGLFLLNDKGHSTCVRPQGSSVVDLVWVTGIIRDRTTSCFVDDEESLSDHKFVVFSFIMGGDLGGCYRDRSWADFPRWKTSGVDRDRLGAALISADWTRPKGTLGADAWVQWLRSSLSRACDIAMQRAGPGRGGRRKDCILPLGNDGGGGHSSSSSCPSLGGGVRGCQGLRGVRSSACSGGCVHGCQEEAIADWKEEEIGLIGSGAPGERVRLAVAPVLDRWVGGVASLGVTFHSTQLMTGHGCFSAYLFRIRRLESSRCFHCDEPFDDADHTLMACSCWAEQRGVLQSTTGRDISLPRVVGLAVRNPDKWRAFAQFAGESTSQVPNICGGPAFSPIAEEKAVVDPETDLRHQLTISSPAHSVPSAGTPLVTNYTFDTNIERRIS
ncbi:hypothetical protein M0802_009207 [Mischocyttarus mexicanus]|nr:hypothetical protein M0802_009207 [Mischocyttarus mexicanus]